ncbi:aminotransferase class V-fold PLP-dependent enzyme [Sinomicrobium sp. M5D2P17]
MILKNKKDFFHIPEGVTYLNCSYMSPLLHNVEQAGMDGLQLRKNPWELKAEDWFATAEELRALFARIVNTDKEQVALIPSVSYGIATAAKNISPKPGQNIVVLEQQYPSNIYAWRELAEQSGAEIVTVKKLPEQTWTRAVLEKIDDNTCLVAVPNCHWTDGAVLDLEQVGVRTRSVGAKLVVDGSQSLGAYPFDIDRIKPDFLVSVGYKWLLGPYGLGYLYADKKYTESGKPIEFSWLNKKESENFAGLVDYKDAYRPGARRFDFGEFSSTIQVSMAISALTQILDWGVENIRDTISLLTDEIERRALESGYETVKKSDRVGHMIGIRIPRDKSRSLKDELPRHKIHVSFRGDNMRVAPHIYNSMEDIDKLFALL